MFVHVSIQNLACLNLFFFSTINVFDIVFYSLGVDKKQHSIKSPSLIYS